VVSLQQRLGLSLTTGLQIEMASKMKTAKGLARLLRSEIGRAGVATSTIATRRLPLYMLDPLLLLEPERLRSRENETAVGVSKGFVGVGVSDAVLASIQDGGKMELGDMDDPQSHWTFGQPGEIFQYRYVGSHVVVSGWTCAVLAETLHEITSGQRPPSPRAWARFSKLAQGNDRVLSSSLQDADLPQMLFAGRLLDCPSASVYELPPPRGCSRSDGGSDLPKGLMIVNDYESVDD